MLMFWMIYSNKRNFMNLGNISYKMDLVIVGFKLVIIFDKIIK